MVITFTGFLGSDIKAEESYIITVLSVRKESVQVYVCSYNLI